MISISSGVLNTLALLKMAEGEISKVQIEGSPISNNGSELKSEGSQRKSL